MKKYILSICCLGAALTLTADDNPIPRQFRVWGSKAPFTLSKVYAVTGKVGMESIRIPKGCKEEFADTNTIAPALTAEQQKCSMLPFAFHPQKYLFYYTQPLAAQINKPARAIGTPGEYVQMAFAVRTLKKVDNVILTTQGFTDKSGKTVIPKLNVDLRRIMDLPMPGKQDKRYVVEPRYMESCTDLDFINIAKDYTERFFVTVKIPDNAAPGIVKSTVTITAGNGEKAKMPLMIRVLPFKLDRPDPKNEMNFQILAVLDDNRVTRWGRDNYYHQMLRNMSDIAEHGMNSIGKINSMPLITKNPDGTYKFDFNSPEGRGAYSSKVFYDAIKRAGLDGPVSFYHCFQWDKYGIAKLAKPFTPQWQDLIHQLVQAIEKARKENSWNEFIYAVGDEPGSSVVRINTVKNIAQAIKKAAPHARILAAFNGEWHGAADWYICKDFVDIHCGNYFNDRIIAGSKAAGYKERWLYNGIERTASYDARSHRVFYGYVPYRVGAVGVTQYHYRYAFGGPAKTDFAIFDHINGTRPDYVTTYPAPDGPLPTQQWEAIRQGIYDYKYIFTLKKRLANCTDATAKAKAQKVLDDIYKAIPGDFMSEKRSHHLQKLSPETLDTMRWKVSQAIMAIDKSSKTK